jgi:hypothetical protein
MFIDDHFLKILIHYGHSTGFQLDMIQYKVARLKDTYYASKKEDARYLMFRQFQELTDLFSRLYNNETVEDFYRIEAEDAELEEEEEFER